MGGKGSAETPKLYYVIYEQPLKCPRKNVSAFNSILIICQERRERALGSFGNLELTPAVERGGYRPVHRGEEVKLVMVKGQGYVPEHSPMAVGQ